MANTHRAQLALPLGLMGLVGAWLTADFFALTTRGRDADVRTAMMIAVPCLASLIGLGMGAALRRTVLLFAIAIFGPPLAGAALGAGVSWSVYDGNAPMLFMAEGAFAGAAFTLPAVVLALLAPRIGQARAGSFVDQANQRMLWVVVALAFVLAQIPLAWRDELHPHGFAIGALGVLGLAGMGVLGLLSLSRAEATSLRLAAMQPRDPDSGLPCDNVVDFGVGDDEHEDLERQSYRGSARPRRVVRGDPALSLPTLRTAAAVSLFAVAISLIVTGFALVDPGPAGETAFQRGY